MQMRDGRNGQSSGRCKPRSNLCKHLQYKRMAVGYLHLELSPAQQGQKRTKTIKESRSLFTAAIRWEEIVLAWGKDPDYFISSGR